MPQARGTQFGLAIYDEDTYGQDPASPVGKKIYLKTSDLKSSQNRIHDDTLTQDRSRAEPALGNKDAAGNIDVALNAESFCYLLKHALGVVTTGRPVSQQPTNVTGVVAEYAEKTAPAGNGTLSFTASGTTLAWAASGDTAGAAQDVSGGGSFTLQSNTAGQSITVTVTPGSLPGSNQSDANITVVAAYEHRFTLGDLPTGMTVEKDYGANISGSGRLEKFNGCKVGSMALSFPQEGYPAATFSLKGAGSAAAATSIDASWTDPGHVAFSSFAAVVKEGGSGIAVLTEANIGLDNGLDESGYTLGSGTRGQLPEGFATIDGDITAMFDSNTLLNKALTDTETSLQITMSRGDGYGTAGNETLDILVQQLKYEPVSPGIDGPAGVFINLPFKGYRNSSGTKLGLLVTVRNQLSSV